MKAIETYATVGEQGSLKIGNLPTLRNRKEKVLILVEENTDTDFYSIALTGLSDAYSVDEPDYQLSSVNAPNDDYAGR